jgi:replicative DNA helicase
VSKTTYLPTADALASWRDDLFAGRRPTLYPVGEGELARVEVGPGRVTLFGGPPGAGKTALVMQLVIDALRMTPTLRAVVCNVEMAPSVLLDRQLARLSGIDLNAIRMRQLGEEHAGRVGQGLATLEAVAPRLAFVEPPYTLENVAAAAEEFRADVMVLDYIQRILPTGRQADRRARIDAAMGFLRQFAARGLAVVAVAAVARTRDDKGRSGYHGPALGLGSFRESSELEFGADDAFMLTPDPDDPGGALLKHLKARYSEPRDIALTFQRPLQRFAAPGGADGELAVFNHLAFGTGGGP